MTRLTAIASFILFFGFTTFLVIAFGQQIEESSGGTNFFMLPKKGVYYIFTNSVEPPWFIFTNTSGNFHGNWSNTVIRVTHEPVVKKIGKEWEIRFR